MHCKDVELGLLYVQYYDHDNLCIVVDEFFLNPEPSKDGLDDLLKHVKQEEERAIYTEPTMFTIADRTFVVTHQFPYTLPPWIFDLSDLRHPGRIDPIDPINPFDPIDPGWTDPIDPVFFGGDLVG